MNDDVGTELEGVAAAVHEARKVLASIAAEAIIRGHSHVTVDFRDKDRAVLQRELDDRYFALILTLSRLSRELFKTSLIWPSAVGWPGDRWGRSLDLPGDKFASASSAALQLWSIRWKYIVRGPGRRVANCSRTDCGELLISSEAVTGSSFGVVC